jgi:hypothetical protein
MNTRLSKRIYSGKIFCKGSLHQINIPNKKGLLLMSRELTLQQGKWNGKERRMKYQGEQQCGTKAKLCN